MKYLKMKWLSTLIPFYSFYYFLTHNEEFPETEIMFDASFLHGVLSGLFLSLEFLILLYFIL